MSRGVAPQDATKVLGPHPKVPKILKTRGQIAEMRIWKQAWRKGDLRQRIPQGRAQVEGTLRQRIHRVEKMGAWIAAPSRKGRPELE